MNEVNAELWLKTFNENYYGRSPEAIDLTNFIKDSFKGFPYIPWAVAERLARQQDPTLVLEKVRNEKGGLIHSDESSIVTIIPTGASAGMTEVSIKAHMVKVRFVFFGIEFIEDYPIQDNKYEPPKVYDQNLLNKALQRATAKVISRGTGLGLRLYEKADLQFVPDEEIAVQKPEITIAPPVSTRRKNAAKAPTETESAELNSKVQDEVVSDSLPKSFDSEPEPLVSDVTYDHVKKETCDELAHLLLHGSDKEAMARFLKAYNSSFLKTYGWTVTLLETQEELVIKLIELTDPAKMLTNARARGLKESEEA